MTNKFNKEALHSALTGREFVGFVPEHTFVELVNRLSPRWSIESLIEHPYAKCYFKLSPSGRMSYVLSCRTLVETLKSHGNNVEALIDFSTRPINEAVLRSNLLLHQDDLSDSDLENSNHVGGLKKKK